MRKKFFGLIAILCAAVLSVSSPVNAADLNQYNDEIIEIETVEENEAFFVPSYGGQLIYDREEEVHIEDLLKFSQVKRINQSGDISGTFTSAKFDTGTPGVKWYYMVNYTISPMSSGTGWYFKSAKCTVSVHKEKFLYTWADLCEITITSATHKLSPASRPTSLKVDVTLHFKVISNSTGLKPITYTENHNHTTTVSNMYY